ncbi:MAG: type II toxin-antitoxin system HipA family toxin [Akkermansiaceae bacterium]
MKIEVLYLGGDEHLPVGHLAEAEDGRVFFEYAPSWRDRHYELSPVYLPASKQGTFTCPTPSFGPLFGLFADSLPDWWGEQMMKQFFGEKGIPWNKVTALQKLACTGGHAMGAIGYEPPFSGGTFRDELTVEVAELVKNANDFIGGDVNEMIPGLLRSGLSPGGAQPKVLLGFNCNFTKSVAGGGALPDGYDRWLLKFDLDPEYELGKEEYAYSRMARGAGIEMAETHLLEGEGGSCHFLTKRFDRPGDRRRHVHTYSGLTHTLVREGLEYGELMDLTRSLTQREGDVEEVFRRACFNVLAGNDDDHAKNHAFIMQPDGQWRISPAYDLTRTTNPLVTGMRAAAVMGKTVDVSRRDLKKLGESQSVRQIDSIIEEVLTAIQKWPEYADEANMSSFRVEQTQSEMPGTGM